MQVDFDDGTPSGKRRRTNADGATRPDVLSGLIGKRVWVPRRARSAMCAPAAPRSNETQTNGAAHTHPQSVCQPPGDLAAAPAQDDSAVSVEAKDAQEEFAVMGLLSLCKAS